jgi:hypothetical protein
VSLVKPSGPGSMGEIAVVLEDSCMTTATSRPNPRLPAVYGAGWLVINECPTSAHVPSFLLFESMGGRGACWPRRSSRAYRWTARAGAGGPGN